MGKKIENFQVNHTYSNADIVAAFECAPQDGMRRSHKTGTLVLISNNTGESIYKNKWTNNQLHYTVMGQQGAQSLDFMQNKILSQLKINKVRAYLFEVFKKREYTFAGEICLAGEPYTEIELDKKGAARKVYKFPLEILNNNYAPPEQLVRAANKKIEYKMYNKSDKDIMRIAEQQSEYNIGKSLKREVIATRYERNLAIREYALRLANGVCQLCNRKAPFKYKETPFLEVHHIEYLSEGGEDTIENTIAVCPNCHRRLHVLELKEDKDKLLEKIAERKLKDNGKQE